MGRKPTTWPANNCQQIMVCACAMLSNCVWLQIIFCSCVNETTFFSFLRSLLPENGRSHRFLKIFLKKNKPGDRVIKQLSRGDVSFSSCQEENWKFFVLLEHLSSYNFVQRATNIKLRANGRNIVGQQLPTMLGVVASVCMSLKVFPVSNIGQQFPTTRNNM